MRPPSPALRLALAALLAPFALAGCRDATTPESPAPARPAAAAEEDRGPALPTGAFRLDTTRSRASFGVGSTGFSMAAGQFGGLEAAVLSTDGTLRGLRARAMFDASTIQTGDSTRDAHLRGEGFFDTGRNAAVEFVGDAPRDVRGSRFALPGRLTIRGVSRPVVFDARLLDEDPDEEARPRLAFTAETTINRQDYGLDWGAMMEMGALAFGEEVRLTLDVHAVQTSASPAGPAARP